MALFPTTPPSAEADSVVAALRCSAALLEADGAARPDAAFQQRARAELLRTLASSPSRSPHPQAVVPGLRRLIGGRPRLAGMMAAVALCGVVAAPAIAAPATIAGAVTGAVHAVREAPTLLPAALFAPGAKDASDRNESSDVISESATIAATRSTASAAPGRPMNEAAASSGAKNATAPQGRANRDGGRVTTTTSAMASPITGDSDGHGDAVSAIARQAPPAGPDHGQAGGGARSRSTSAMSSAESAATSGPDADNHGDAVSAAAHAPAPIGETHGQQVSSIAHLVVSATTNASSASASIAPPARHPGKRNDGGTPSPGGADGHGQAHGH